MDLHELTRLIWKKEKTSNASGGQIPLSVQCIFVETNLNDFSEIASPISTNCEQARVRPQPTSLDKFSRKTLIGLGTGALNATMSRRAKLSGLRFCHLAVRSKQSFRTLCRRALRSGGQRSPRRSHLAGKTLRCWKVINKFLELGCPQSISGPCGRSTNKTNHLSR